jgi:hypothetical protein
MTYQEGMGEVAAHTAVALEEERAFLESLHR